MARRLWTRLRCRRSSSEAPYGLSRNQVLGVWSATRGRSRCVVTPFAASSARSPTTCAGCSPVLLMAEACLSLRRPTAWLRLRVGTRTCCFRRWPQRLVQRVPWVAEFSSPPQLSHAEGIGLATTGSDVSHFAGPAPEEIWPRSKFLVDPRFHDRVREVVSGCRGSRLTCADCEKTSQRGRCPGSETSWVGVREP